MRKLLGYARIWNAWKIRKSIVVGYVPEDIAIELTNTCNFKCSFCPQSDPRHFEMVSRTTLSPERADILLRKLRQGGVRTDVIHLTLDGEPFVNKKIGEICARAIHHQWRHFIFSTNGYFCTPDRLALLPDHGAARYRLCIDFCADERIFETHRGTPGSWAKVRDNILGILAERRFRHISVEIADISAVALADAGGLRAQHAALRAMFPRSGRLRITSRVFHNATGFVQGILERKRTSAHRYNLCPYPWTSMVIASNGDVVACCRDLQHKTVLGNLFEQDLQGIWNGEPFQAMRRALVAAHPGAIRACAQCDLPYDQDRFSLRHLIRTGISRLGIFE